MTEGKISLPDTGLKVSYLMQGDSGIQPSFLFLHGNVGSKSWWRPLFDILPEEMYLLAPDLRGCGSTGFIHEDFSLAALLEDLERFVEVLELSSLALVAHSTSCPLAIEFALKYGHLLHCLVLVGSPPLAGIATPPEGFKYLQRAVRDPKLAQDLLASLLPHTKMESVDNSAFLTQLVNEILRMSPKALDSYTRNLEFWECEDRIGGLIAPVLLVRGEDDQIAPHAMTLQTLLSIPAANNLEVIKGAGHAPMIENPSAFATRLIDFVFQDFQSFESVRQQPG